MALDELAQEVDRTVLREGPISDRMRTRIREDFGESDIDEIGGLGACVVLFREAATDEVLDRLDALCRARFARPLPPELRAFWKRTNGLSASVLGPDEDPSDPALAEPVTVSQEFAMIAPEGILTAEAASRELAAEHAEITHPDGRVEKRGLLALPFFEVPDQGWYALDLFRSDGVSAPVIAYWHDEVSLLAPDRAREAAKCEVVAPDLATWLRTWIESGFDPFPHLERERPATEVMN